MSSKQTYRQSSSRHLGLKNSSGSSSSKATTAKNSFEPSSSKATTSTPRKCIKKWETSDQDIWKTVEPRMSDENAIIVIVSNSQEKDSLNQFLREEQKFSQSPSKERPVDLFKPRRASDSPLMVATPDELQVALGIASNMKVSRTECSGKSRRSGDKKTSPKKKINAPTTLHIIVSSSIRTITYEISENFKNVMVMQSHAAQAVRDMYSLCITPSSKYCGIEAWKWEYRSSFSDHSLSHLNGIYHDTQSLTAQDLSFNPEIFSAITPESSVQIEDKFRHCVKHGNRDEALSASTSMGPSARTDEKVSWFERYLGLIASVTGAAVGIFAAAASFSFCWFNAGGFFVKGPLGLYLSGGYFSAGALGGACLASVGKGIAVGVSAAAAVYYIPWGTVWNCVKRVLNAIWDKIKEYAVCIGEKLKTLVEDVASALRQGISGNAFPYMAKPPRFND